MFAGTVTFVAKIKGNGFAFPSVGFNPNNQHVQRVVIESPSPDGNHIDSELHVTSVLNHQAGIAIAAEANMEVLDLICFLNGISIECQQMTAAQFAPMDPEPGVLVADAGEYVMIGEAIGTVVSCSEASILAQLAQLAHPQKRMFGLFRAARQSASPVEEFIHLYNLLLMLCNDNQDAVDRFIVSEEPTVPQTQSPIKRAGTMETIYTKLRNEMAHVRQGVNLGDTKREMVNRLSGLITLTRRAIDLRA